MLSFEDVLKEFEDFLQTASYLEVLPCRWGYFRCAVFLYSNGNNPVLLRNNSANRLEVEYPTVWATCPTVSSVYASRYSAWLMRRC